MLEKTLESPFDLKDIQPVHPKGNQSWIFIGRTDAEAEVPILWPPDAKNWLIGKDPDAGKDWRWEDKRMTENEMYGWHHWLDWHEFEQAPRIGNGWGSLARYSPQSMRLQRVGQDWAVNIMADRHVRLALVYICQLVLLFQPLCSICKCFFLYFYIPVNGLPRWLRRAKCLHTVWETRVQSLGLEDPLEKKMATHSSTLAWKIPWTEERSRLQSMGSQRVKHDWLSEWPSERVNS